MSEKVLDLEKIIKNVFLSAVTTGHVTTTVFLLQADVPKTEVEEEQSQQAAQ